MSFPPLHHISTNMNFTKKCCWCCKESLYRHYLEFCINTWESPLYAEKHLSILKATSFLSVFKEYQYTLSNPEVTHLNWYKCHQAAELRYNRSADGGCAAELSLSYCAHDPAELSYNVLPNGQPTQGTGKPESPKKTEIKQQTTTKSLSKWNIQLWQVQGQSMLTNYKVQMTYEGKTENFFSFDHVVNNFMKNNHF